MSLRRGRRADRGNWPPTAAALRSSAHRRHPGDEPCAARGRGISPAPDAPSARAEPRDARQPTSDCIAAPSPSPSGPVLSLRAQRSNLAPISLGHRDCFVAVLLAMTTSFRLVLHQRTGGRAVFETLTAARAFDFLHLVQVPRFEQGRPDRRFRAHLAAETAGIADRVVDPHLHLMPPTWCNK